MLNTLQSLVSNSNTDASQRVQGFITTPGDVLSITVTDSPNLQAPETVSYTVQAGDGFTQIAAGLAAAVTADSNLTNDQISASASGTVVNISSNSSTTPSYTSSVTSSTSLPATETMTLSSQGGGQELVQLSGVVQQSVPVFSIYSTLTDYNNGP
jgi:phage tail sheath gpL-like